MTHKALLRRVHARGPVCGDTLTRTSPHMKRRRPPCQETAAQTPRLLRTDTRGRNTLSVPAHEAAEPTPRNATPQGVTPTAGIRDHSRLLAEAAANEAITDRAMRVYTVVVTLDTREVTAAGIVHMLPGLTEAAAGQLLGDLVSHGLLTKRLRTIGYNDDGNRIRRSAYSLADEGMIA